VVGSALAVVHLFHLTTEDAPLALLIGVVIPIGLSLIIVGVGLHLYRTRDRSRGAVMTAWMVLAMTWMGIAGTGAVLYQLSETAILSDPEYLIAIFATYGAVPGLITGWYDASRQRQLDVVSNREEQLKILSRILRHNVRNDMNVILGRAEEIERDSEGASERHAGKILAVGDQLLRLTEKEHQWVESLLESSERSPIEIRPLVTQVVEDLRAEYPGAEITLSNTECLVRAIPEIELALRELLENAIVHNDADHPEVRVEVKRIPDGVRLTVSDNGPGIPSEEVSFVRDRSHRTPLHHASSLGLQLATHVVEQSKGTIRFETLPTRGTAVTIELARSDRGGLEPDSV
jgi:signal transduction histidine kinase